jgi:nitrite reductase/ring-hydroxylating ferredoxin subunit/uncharacterized membrane protein
VFRSIERFIEQQTWLDTIGDPLQKSIGDTFTSLGDGGKQLKNLLNGTWLGHPAHPMITDVPVGAWTCTVLLDIVGSATGDHSLEKAADITLATGLTAAVGAAATGLTDWSDTYGKDRKVGLLHGLMMLATVATYTGSLLARLGGARTTGVFLANAGYGLLSAGAYLGGDEVYDVGYGVKRTAFTHGPSKFVPVMAETELPADTPTKTDAGGVAVLLVKQGNQIFALDDTCVHAGCSLAGGKLEGRSIICPCHGSQLDLADGAIINGPATYPEPRYDVRVQDGMIEVKYAEG